MVRREVYCSSLPNIENAISGVVKTENGDATYRGGFLVNQKGRSGIEVDFLDARRSCKQSNLNGSGRIPDGVHLHVRPGEGWKVHLSKNKTELETGEYELAQSLLSEPEVRSLF